MFDLDLFLKSDPITNLIEINKWFQNLPETESSFIWKFVFKKICRHFSQTRRKIGHKFRQTRAPTRTLTAMHSNVYARGCNWLLPLVPSRFYPHRGVL